MVVFHLWLQDQLALRGMKQNELARRMGRDPALISKIVNGLTQPKEVLCKALAEALELPYEEVFRAAGLIEDKPVDQVDQILEEIILQLGHCNVIEKADILAYIRMRRKFDESLSDTNSGISKYFDQIRNGETVNVPIKDNRMP